MTAEPHPELVLEPVQPPKRRPPRLRAKPPRLSIRQALTWADAHHERTGRWPNKAAGRVFETLQETWCGINLALRRGGRGLPGGTTLARLLLERRGVRNHLSVPQLSDEQILAWADAHHRRTGVWPTEESGPIPGADDETWAKVNAALYQGLRGLAGGRSLARLLAAERGVPNRKALPALSVEQIVAWADAFFARHGRWPTRDDGNIEGEEEAWSAVDAALHNGSRGLPAGTSLARVLQRERGARNRKDLPPLSEHRILAWAKKHRRATGSWPNENSGPVAGAAGEVWANVNQALRDGTRDLPGGDTLARLLARRLGAHNGANIPPLTVPQVLAWADAHHQRTGRWPKANSGEVADAPGETWCALDDALRHGLRELPRGLSLARLLARDRGVRNLAAPPRLTVRQILRWAEEHHRRRGRWPSAGGGPIPGAGGETWTAVGQALRKGRRGLPGGDSLPRLLNRQERSVSGRGAGR